MNQDERNRFKADARTIEREITEARALIEGVLLCFLDDEKAKSNGPIFILHDLANLFLKAHDMAKILKWKMKLCKGAEEALKEKNNAVE